MILDENESAAFTARSVVDEIVVNRNNRDPKRPT